MILMTTEKMKMRTNARLVAKVLTKYRDTFYALKELINNSLYAKASRIDIEFIPSKCDSDSICFHTIEKSESQIMVMVYHTQISRKA